MNHLLYVYMDGSTTPEFILQEPGLAWRPEKGDTSWRVEDAMGRVVDEYHPRNSVKGNAMQLIVKVRMRTVYGRDLIYPDNDAAFGLAAIARTETISPSVLNIAKRQLGATVLVEQEDDGRMAKQKLDRLLKEAA